MPSPPGHVSKEAIAEARRIINGGNEESIGLQRIGSFRCEATTPAKPYRPEGGNCPYEAKFQTTIGRKLCRLHAELWAAEHAPPSTPARKRIVMEEGCAQCAELARGSFGPYHDPSPNCQSGKRPHCTCDTCF